MWPKMDFHWSDLEGCGCRSVVCNDRCESSGSTHSLDSIVAVLAALDDNDWRVLFYGLLRTQFMVMVWLNPWWFIAGDWATAYGGRAQMFWGCFDIFGGSWQRRWVILVGGRKGSTPLMFSINTERSWEDDYGKRQRRQMYFYFFKEKKIIFELKKY